MHCLMYKYAPVYTMNSVILTSIIVTHFLISQNLRERMFVVQILLLIVILLLLLMPHRLGRPSGVDHTTPLKCCTLCYSIVSHGYTSFIVSRIYVNTTKLPNITCTLVATGVILRSLECTETSDGWRYSFEPAYGALYNVLHPSCVASL